MVKILLLVKMLLILFRTSSVTYSRQILIGRRNSKPSLHYLYLLLSLGLGRYGLGRRRRGVGGQLGVHSEEGDTEGLLRHHHRTQTGQQPLQRVVKPVSISNVRRIVKTTENSRAIRQYTISPKNSSLSHVVSPALTKRTVKILVPIPYMTTLCTKLV